MLSAKRALRLGHEAALVAPPDIRPDGDGTAILAPRDDRRSVSRADLRQLRREDPRSVSGRDQDLRNGRRTAASLGHEARHHVEAALAFEDAPDRGTAESEVDDVLHVGDVDAVPGHPGTVDRDLELRLVWFLLDGRVGRAIDLSEEAPRLPGQRPELPSSVPLRITARSADDPVTISVAVSMIGWVKLNVAPGIAPVSRRELVHQPGLRAARPPATVGMQVHQQLVPVGAEGIRSRVVAAGLEATVLTSGDSRIKRRI